MDIASPKNCISENVSNKILPMLEKLADEGIVNNEKKVSVLQGLEKSCYRHSYIKGKYKIILFKDPNELEDKAEGSIHLMDSSIDNIRSCLNDAIKTIENLDLPLSKAILIEHKKRNKWIWDDIEIGPVKWLKCDDKTSRAWFESIDIFLHELNHENRTVNCMFLAQNNYPLCFSLSSILPNRSIAKIQDFPTKDINQLQAMEFFQKIYLTDIDQPPFILFDELNSYTISTITLSSILKKYGKKSLFDDQDRRQGVFLPLFLVYTLRYLEQLKLKNPKLFKTEFLDNKQNRNSLKTILNEAEFAYEQWVLLLKENKLFPKEIENGLWNQYKKLKIEFKI